MNYWAGCIVVIMLLCMSCEKMQKENMTTDALSKFVKDPHSYAKAEEAAVKHIDLDLLVDFDQKKITGSARLKINRRENAEKLVLDIKGLEINSIKDQEGKPLEYKIAVADPILGSALEIKLLSATEELTVEYATGKEAEALQWLEPSQTADKTDPFLFTQSQAILARSWIPLQDSPAVRFTYSARVQVPRGMMALMSAENPDRINEDGIYLFSMNQPIPSYLMALAVGKIAFSPVGERTGVYAEPLMIESVREEFSEMEEMLLIAEDLYGAYQWERYDLIVLPPSFPFGGMENPRITFATPTILAGDKSLTSLVAHELAHSWSGNLVTNATWNDFWLNEGFTVYFENRIMEALKGKDYSDMLTALSMQGLQEEVGLFMDSGKMNDTKLKLDLSGRNPDDGVTTIAYDKGYFFLLYLENYVGREKFDQFLNQYFEEHAFRSNHTEAFLRYLDENLFQRNNIEPVDDLDEWIYGTGLPASIPTVISTRFEEVDRVLENRKQSNFDMDTTGWSSHEWVYFIKNLPSDVSKNTLASLDEQYQLTQSGNAEILGVWFPHCIRRWYEPSLSYVRNFLVHTGRRKFLMPIYQELVNTEEGKTWARNVYEEARPNYHFVSANSIDKLLL